MFPTERILTGRPSQNRRAAPGAPPGKRGKAHGVRPSLDRGDACRLPPPAVARELGGVRRGRDERERRALEARDRHARQGQVECGGAPREEETAEEEASPKLRNPVCD